jgi:hypothetical protein
MSRFLFLNAIAVAKTEGQEAFALQLQEMLTQHPESELASMAKDMLALMGQGAESQSGDLSSLQAKRTNKTNEVETTASDNRHFDPTRLTSSLVLLVMQQDESKLNQLLYEIALFNFSQFMIKDFDIKQLANFTPDQSAIIVAGFEKMDEAEWYNNLLQKNFDIQQSLQSKNVQVICISETNYQLLQSHFTITDYNTWLLDNTK